MSDLDWDKAIEEQEKGELTDKVCFCCYFCV